MCKHKIKSLTDWVNIWIQTIFLVAKFNLEFWRKSVKQAMVIIVNHLD